MAINDESWCFLLALNKLLNKWSSCRWFEMPQCSCDLTVLCHQYIPCRRPDCGNLILSCLFVSLDHMELMDKLFVVWSGQLAYPRLSQENIPRKYTMFIKYKEYQTIYFVLMCSIFFLQMYVIIYLSVGSPLILFSGQLRNILIEISECFFMDYACVDFSKTPARWPEPYTPVWELPGWSQD